MGVLLSEAEITEIVRGSINDESNDLSDCGAEVTDANLRVSLQGKTILVTLNQVASFSLTELPGCCGVLVSHGAFVYPRYRGKGIGKILARIRVEIATKLGYTTLLCTDVDTNVPQQRILGKLGYKKVWGFTNRRTNNPVSIHCVELIGD